jgi:predicted DNA-binding protein with PD1-like motif
MAIKNWDTKTSRVVYRRFEAGESLMEGLESLALSEGIREAAVISCIGSLSQLKRRNLCGRDEDGVTQHEWETINQVLELVSAEGYIQPLEEGGLRVHIHVAAARPSGEIIGGHCEDATCFTGAYVYLQVIEESRS